MRKRVLTPPLSAVSVANRGFHAKSPAAVALLETVGASFLAGYRYAVGSRAIADAESLLETVPRQFRGFAYEGAAMGYAIMDGLSLGRRNRVSAFLTGPAQRHIYMAYVGIGWACARLPRWRWRRVLPADPVLTWLVLDGYGFHQAYFRTRRYVDGRHQDPPAGWPFDPAGGYPIRAVDQGIGRALWFVAGTDVRRLAARIGTFPQLRRADLWSGAALAATYAGGADEPELQLFRDLAGEYRRHVAQAATFAAEARVRADLVTEHTAVATGVFCGMTPQQAAALAARTRAGLPASDSVPAYEVWRERIADHFVSLGRC